ncbi:hypothetical protein [Legionella quateirensis]|uniref:Uncharacterized protein n=1 Tax=Legionella quateirensis TaxID=45072 RepID=A0A378KWG1_9GAMM|nr:hypothetical protein [Legionella quateirensis]KTD46308.1 hypothetical protein Lqua_2411 [Legionella quateirensis]STY18922.1 Uncharacterised protein [Legionella quateirensis]
MKLFTQKPVNQEEKEIRVQFLKNIHSLLSRDLLMGSEEKQKILFGALLYTGLTKEEVQETLSNQYN